MHQVAFLLSPEQFPHNLFLKALDRARLHESSFRLIIITDEKLTIQQMTAEQQMFDDEVQPLKLEGNKINTIIHQVKYVRKFVTDSGLNFSSTLLVQPRIKDVLEEVRFAGMIYFEYRDIHHKSSFDWQQFFHLIPMHKKVISNKVYG